MGQRILLCPGPAKQGTLLLDGQADQLPGISQLDREFVGQVGRLTVCGRLRRAVFGQGRNERFDQLLHDGLVKQRQSGPKVFL